jgi:hypothetical protein
LWGFCVRGGSNVDNPPAVSDEYYCPNVQLDIVMHNVAITVTDPPNAYSGFTGVRIERTTAADPTFMDAVVVQPFAAIYTPTDIPPTSGDYLYRIRFQNGDGISSAYSEGREVNVLPP